MRAWGRLVLLGGLVALLLAGCGARDLPLVVGVTPTPTANVGPPSAAQATTTAALATARAQAARGGPRQRLWLMTGATGSAEERYGRGIAQSITDKYTGHEGAAEVSAGPPMNLTALAGRQAHLALVTTDAALAVLDGDGADGPVAVRALATLYPTYLHLLVRADSPIRRLEDLRGQAVALGPPASAGEFVARRALATAGLAAPGDLTPTPLGPAESLRALREGQVGAVFWLGPLSADLLTTTADRAGLSYRLVPLGEAATAMTRRHGPAYRPATIPAGAYPGQAGALPTVAVDMVLVASASLDERLVHGVLTAMFDNLGELPFFHPEARRLTLLTAAQPAPVPFHPGAARYYREKGVLP